MVVLCTLFSCECLLYSALPLFSELNIFTCFTFGGNIWKVILEQPIQVLKILLSYDKALQSLCMICGVFSMSVKTEIYPQLNYRSNE